MYAKTLNTFLLVFWMSILAAQNDTVSLQIMSGGGKFNVKEITSEIGLLGATAEQVFQDSKGYVWITTRSGLNRYDGYSIKNFTEDDGLVFNHTRFVEEDRDGRIWIGTENGVSCYNGFKFENFTEENGLAFRQVWCLREHKDGGMLVGTSFGVDLIRNGQVEHLIDFDTTNAGGNMVRSINYDSEGNLWVGATDGYFRFNDELEREHIKKAYFPQAFLQHSDGSIWLGTWGKYCYRYENGNITNYEIGTPVTGFAEGIDGSVWMSTWEKGLIKLKDNTLVQYGTREGMTMNTMWNVMVDKEGCVWGATYGSGVNLLINERFSLIDEQLGLGNNVVNAVDVDSAGNIWVGTEGGVTLIRPDGSTEIFDEEDGFMNGKVMDLTVDRNDHVWAILYSGGNGLIEFADGKIKEMHGMGGFSVHQDSKGNLWVGTDGGGVYRKFGPDKELRYAPKHLHKSRGFRTFEDSKGRIWLAMDHNAWHVFHPEINKAYDTLFPVDLRPIAGAAMTEDFKGNFWISLERKAAYLCSYTEGELTILDTLDKADGLPDNAIWDFLAEGSALWIHTQSGLSRMDLNTYYENGEIAIKNYTVKEGYLGDGSSRLCRKNETELLMGTSKGLLTFHENNDRSIDTPPFTNITSVKLNQKDVNWSDYEVKLKINSNVPKEMILPYDQNHLTFSYVGISFSAPQEVTYKYMLEGFDEDWSPETRQREIVYSNISPGTYTFKVISANIDGVWDDSPDTITIIIVPPFWQTWWFRTIALIILALIIYAFFQYRTKKLRAANDLLERKVNQRTEQLQVAYDQIEEKNHEITDSISYAKRIQEAILPPTNYFNELMGESFVFYKPKDIVAGDFYWLNTAGDKVLFAAADCTGHGVPGAMVSVVCHGALNRSVREFELNEPAKILDKTREIVIETFSKSKEDVKDGMDVSLCSLDRKTGVLEFAGANNSLYLIKDGEIEEIRADRQPVGKFDFAQPFTNHTVKIEKGHCLYLFSDGFADQFGGDKGKKMKYKPFKDMLLKIHERPMHEQMEILNTEFEKWRGDFEQVDDVCIIGVRL